MLSAKNNHDYKKYFILVEYAQNPGEQRPPVDTHDDQIIVSRNYQRISLHNLWL